MYCDAILTLDVVTEPVQLLHGAGVTLQALGPTVLLQGSHRERLLQGQHDFIHLPMRSGPKSKSVKPLHILDPLYYSALGCLTEPHQSLVCTLEDVAHKLAAPAFIRLSTDKSKMIHMPYTLHTERQFTGLNSGF